MQTMSRLFDASVQCNKVKICIATLMMVSCAHAEQAEARSPRHFRHER